MTRVHLILSTVLVLVALQIAAVPAPTVAQTAVWTRPFEVSPPLPRNIGGIPPQGQGIVNAALISSSWFPNIAVGPEGSVHIIWNSGSQQGNSEDESIDTFMYRALLNGQWTEPNSIFITGKGGWTIRNGIAVGPDGKVNVSFRSKTNILFMRASWNNAWGAQQWSEPRTVNSLSVAYYNTLAVDRHNVLHLVWSEAVINQDKLRPECQNCANMFYRQSHDNGESWSAPINLSNSNYGDNRPQMVIDARDRIHVVWDQGRDWSAGLGSPKRGVYVRSDDGGLSWTKPYYIEAPALDPVPRSSADNQQSNPNAVQQTTIGVQANGNPLIVYRTVSGRIFSQFSNDGGATWQLPRQIEGISARDRIGNDLDKFSMVFDGAGIAHLIIVGFPKPLAQMPENITDPPKLLHLAWNGTSWSQATLISDYLAPDYPTAVISGNTLHVVWFTRDPKTEGTQNLIRRYQIWYSSRLVGGQAVQLLPTFTPEPVQVETATPQPTLIPTMTPLPAAVASAPPGVPPAWEQQGVITILLALLPVLGLFGAIIVFQRVRARRH